MPFKHNPLDLFEVVLRDGRSLGGFPDFGAAERFGRQAATAHCSLVTILHLEGPAADIMPDCEGRVWTDLTVLGTRFA